MPKLRNHSRYMGSHLVDCLTAAKGELGTHANRHLLVLLEGLPIHHHVRLAANILWRRNSFRTIACALRNLLLQGVLLQVLLGCREPHRDEQL